MAKNMFVNTTGLPIEKEMPSLVGMDFSNVGKEPLKLNIGKTISDFATKAQAVKEQVNATKVYNKILDANNQWRIDNLSDPNAFSTKERRTEIAKSYNTLIEQQKAMLLGAKGTVSANQYSELEQQFKQQTYNSLFDLQTKMNSAFVQESVESMNIEKNALLIKCANTSNESEIMQYQDMLAQCFDAEASLGIDNREQAIKTFSTIQSNFMERAIENDIINSRDKQFAVLDDSGQPILDLSGNYIMDSTKILRAVEEKRTNLLSKEGITPVAKQIAKKFHISEDEAYNYIYHARDQYFNVKGQNIQANLAQKTQLKEYQLFEVQTKINENIAKTVAKLDVSILDGSSLLSINRDILNIPTDSTIYSNKFEMNRAYGSQINNLQDIQRSGRYIPVLDKKTIDGFEKDINSSKDKYQLMEAVDKIRNNFQDGGGQNPYNLFILSQIQSNGIMTYGEASALTGLDSSISQDEAIDIFINNRTINADLSKASMGYNQDFCIDFKDRGKIENLLKNVKANPERYLSGDSINKWNSKTNDSDRLSLLVQEYNDDKNDKKTKTSLNDLAGKIETMETVSGTKMLRMNTSHDSDYYKFAKDTIEFNIKGKNASKLYKANKPELILNNNNGIISVSGYPTDMNDLSTSTLNAYNGILESYILKGVIDLQTINEYNNGMIFKNKNNINYFTQVVKNMMNSEDEKIVEIINKPEFLISIPTAISDNDKEIQKLLQDRLNKIKK